MRFDWTRPVIALSTAAMEASWIYLLLFVLTSLPNLSKSALHPLAVFGLLAGSLLYTALLDFLGLQGRFYRGIFITLAVVASIWLSKGGITGHYGLFNRSSWQSLLGILGDLNDPQFLRTVAALVASLLLCWRGTALHQSEMEAPARSFRLGIVVACFSMVLATFKLDIQEAGPNLIRAIVSFFFFGLLAVAVTQLRRGRGNARQRPGVHWFLILLPTIGLVLAIGILIASLFSPELGGLITAAWNRLVQGAVWLISPIAVAGYVIAQLLAGLFHAPQPGVPVPTPPPTPTTPGPSPEEGPMRLPGVISSPGWGAAVTGVVVALILAGVVYLIWLFLSRARSGDEVLEERESLWSWEQLSLNLQDWLARFRRQAGPQQGLRALLGRLRGAPTTVAIRRMYIHLLLLALDRGLERKEGQTPREYLQDLRQGIPECATEEGVLTEAYVRARYDPWPASPDLVREAEDAWEKISQQQSRPGSPSASRR